MRPLVRICSDGRGWTGVTCWHQTQPTAGEVLLPPLLDHHLAVQGDAATRIYQRREGRRDHSVWRQNDLAIVPAGLPTAWSVREQGDLAHLDLDCRFVERVAAQAFEIDPASLSLNSVLHAHDDKLGMLARMLLTELGDHPTNGRFYAESIANVVAVQLITKFSSRAPVLAPARGGLTPARYRRCIDFIHANLGADLSLDALAWECGYSAWHFARLFRQTSGLSPHRFVIEARLTEAKRLLASPEMTIADVAHRCGMADQSHLSRLFRSHVGTSPAEFQRSAIRDRHRGP
jgi:AraC family transcriptional regulator